MALRDRSWDGADVAELLEQWQDVAPDGVIDNIAAALNDVDAGAYMQSLELPDYWLAFGDKVLTRDLLDELNTAFSGLYRFSLVRAVWPDMFLDIYRADR